MKKTAYLFYLMSFLSFNLFAQEIPNISQFMHNKMVYNPAAAGMNESQFNTNFISRFQWSGIEGAPSNNLFWADYRIAKYKMGMAVNVNSEVYGANRNTDFYANYAYHLKLNRQFKLSLGMRFGASQLQLSTSNLRRWDEIDAVADQASYNFMVPKIGFGAMLTARDFYASISLPDLLVYDQNYVIDDRGVNYFKRKRNYALLTGYRSRVSDLLALSPNIKISHFPTTPNIRFDYNLNFEITDYFWAGATYSHLIGTKSGDFTSNSLTLMAGTYISSRVRFGYAYELYTGNALGIRLQTHEINLMLTLDGLFRKKKN